MRQSWAVPAVCLLCLLLFDVPLQAYLDPGSGSMLLQVVLGGFAALGVVIRLYWNRMTALFRRNDAPRDGR